MVIIRLARSGSHGRPFFYIVATDSRSRRDSNFIEKLGFYNPKASDNAEKYKLNTERFSYWKSVGAQVSPTVSTLVKTNHAM
jgi:small subunit ribosomal protein S16